ncbi:AIPR family protein [Thermobifida halotolerans]|uniref:AIPR family protein n=1 Tax=Thermobifida halotolerans TaxID=483545 RepID=A0AA97LW95_9ACTN|nr:AIPR family protein [Thermobifida halotolerans]UOE19327.1 AIPR family protein [Thermobifida halotolerans]
MPEITPLPVLRVRNFLLREYQELIDLSNLRKGCSEHERNQNLLSRALAALTIRHLSGCSKEQAAAAVIDGDKDQGIDALRVDSDAQDQPRLLLVQSKWSDKGRGSFDQNDARTLNDGLRYLTNTEYEQFNDRFRLFVNQVHRAIMTPGARIVLVVTVMREAPLDPTVLGKLEKLCQDLGGEETVHLRVLYLRDIEAMVREELAGPVVNLDTRLETWAPHASPYQAFHGTVRAAEIADWYKKEGERLFRSNIRQSLGITPVNQEITDTLLTNPSHFFYLNNGITVLCERIVKGVRSSMEVGGSGDFELTGVSIVNGAQTVAAIARAMEQDPQQTARAYVGIKLISLEGCPPDFAELVTQGTNTQNEVKPQDFVALDPLQRGLRDDFYTLLDKTYVIKRGEMAPPPGEGCTVIEAAQALACAQPKAELVARIKKNPDLLWDEHQGVYAALFGKGRRAVQAMRVWSDVLLLRTIKEQLGRERAKREGRAQAVAERGDLLTAHVIFQWLASERSTDSDREHDWHTVIEDLPKLVTTVLDWLTHHVDAEFTKNSFIQSTFTSPERCSLLTERVLASLHDGGEIPELPDTYRPPAKTGKRRPKAVATLLDSGRIPSGTSLVFQAQTGPERRTLAAWLQQDARRGRAVWNSGSRSKPLIWEADGKRYSPSGLVQHMLDLASRERKDRPLQGTTRWFVPGEGSLADLAEQVRREDEEN